MTQLTIEIVTTPEQAEELRRLRNECRQFMTRDTAEITAEQQREFLAGPLADGTAWAYLLRPARGSDAVAYGLLRDDGDHLWLSCGVTGTARGRGLGTLIVQFVTAAAGRGPVRLEVWQGNEAARRVYEKAGYAVTGSGIRDGRVFELMEHA
jgi:RimJ/RimL family protein N-acetyltransferase